MVTVAVPLAVFAHAVPLDSLTPVNAYTKLPETFVGTVTVATLVPKVELIVCDTPLIVYVNPYGAVALEPVNVIVGVAPSLHTAVTLDAIDAVGNGFTVTVRIFVEETVSQANPLNVEIANLLY